MRDMRVLGVITLVIGGALLADGNFLSGFLIFLTGLFFLFFDVIIYQIKLKIWHKENNKNTGSKRISSPEGRKPYKPRNK
jgi:hypothetical protein